MDELKPYTKHGITLLTRETEYHDDQYVIEEVMTYDVGNGAFGTVIDLGAHIGAFTCWLANRQPQAEIVAVEPAPDNFAVLEQNVKPYPMVRAMRTYVSYLPTEPMRIMIHPSHSTCHAVLKASEVQPEMSTVVAPAPMTLEDIMRQCGWTHIGLLKIDIEGGEEDVLLGCADETLLHTDRIAGEFHRGRERFMSTIGLRLTGLGFTVTAEPDPNRHSTFLATRQL